MDRTARMLKLIADSGKRKQDIAKDMAISPSRLSQLINYDEMKESQLLAFCVSVNASPSYVLLGDDDPVMILYNQLPIEYRELVKEHVWGITQILSRR